MEERDYLENALYVEYGCVHRGGNVMHVYLVHATTFGAETRSLWVAPPHASLPVKSIHS